MKQLNEKMDNSTEFDQLVAFQEITHQYLKQNLTSEDFFNYDTLKALTENYINTLETKMTQAKAEEQKIVNLVMAIADCYD